MWGNRFREQKWGRPSYIDGIKTWADETYSNSRNDEPLYMASEGRGCGALCALSGRIISVRESTLSGTSLRRQKTALTNQENLLLLLIQFHNYTIVNCEVIDLTSCSTHRKTTWEEFNHFFLLESFKKKLYWVCSLVTSCMYEVYSIYFRIRNGSFLPFLISPLPPISISPPYLPTSLPYLRGIFCLCCFLGPRNLNRTICVTVGLKLSTGVWCSPE